MPRRSALLVSLVASLVLTGFMVGCQGDSGVPSDPGHDLGLARGPGGQCNNDAFKAAVKIYVENSVRKEKLKACDLILKAFEENKVSQGEKGIDDLLVAIYNDYHLGTAVLAPVSPHTLEQSVANYIGASCGLAGTHLSASECLVVNDLDGDGVDADDLDGWLAAGPLTGTATALGTGLLPNGIFAFGVESTSGTYVFVSERRRTGVDGPCPENFPNDCQDDVFDVDVDVVDPQSGFQSLTVESCAVFGALHVHCPEGAPCVPGETTIPLNLVSDDACTLAGYTTMGLWGQLAFQATRPTQWLIKATPAYAGTSTKLAFFSPVVLADDVPRTRGVDCNVRISQYDRGSEGNTCRIFQGTMELDTCVTNIDGLCTLSPLVPTNIDVHVTVEKTGGGGAYNATSESFNLGPGDPPRDGDNKEVCFDMSPPRAKEVECS